MNFEKTFGTVVFMSHELREHGRFSRAAIDSYLEQSESFAVTE